MSSVFYNLLAEEAQAKTTVDILSGMLSSKGFLAFSLILLTIAFIIRAAKETHAFDEIFSNSEYFIKDEETYVKELVAKERKKAVHDARKTLSEVSEEVLADFKKGKYQMDQMKAPTSKDLKQMGKQLRKDKKRIKRKGK